MQGLNYFKRIFKVYFGKEKGYLSFWHERPQLSEEVNPTKLGAYYQTFEDKARYTGPKDEAGVILFDYFFDIGRQYNPLAVAQYGLGNYNLYLKTKDQKYFDIAKIQADWLVGTLEEERGFHVWKHHFRWHYKESLSSGWYSAHSQGTGISLLARMFDVTKQVKYKKAATQAFASLDALMRDGGVKFIDNVGDTWLEEYRIDPPTHILNGYLWALWGVWDFYLLTKNKEAIELWQVCIKTLAKNLYRYDAGFWSLYDLSKQAMKMVASPFYHDLHIVQLYATFYLSGDETFKKYAERFKAYRASSLHKAHAIVHKAIFKLLYF